MKNYTFLERGNNEYCLYKLIWDSNQFYGPVSLKDLGKLLNMRSDKLLRILEKDYNAHRILYVSSFLNKRRDPTFYISNIEDAQKCEKWIHDTIIKMKIEKKLFI